MGVLAIRINYFSVKEIKVVILSHDRPEMLREAVLSVLNQTRFDLVDLVVSDNSAGNRVESIMRMEFPQVYYLRRSSSLTAKDHFRQILGEIDADYFMMFHDDDIMLPMMVEKLYNKISSAKGIVAVASNAYLLRGSEISRYRVRALLKEKVFTAPRQLAIQYLTLLGTAPFCGYMYKSEFFRNKALRWDAAGKYSDVIFLMEGLLLGSIIWMREALMITRVHGENDSAKFDSYSVGSLLGHFMLSFSWSRGCIRFVPMELIALRNKLPDMHFGMLLIFFLMHYKFKLVYPLFYFSLQKVGRMIDVVLSRLNSFFDEILRYRIFYDE